MISFTVSNYDMESRDNEGDTNWISRCITISNVSLKGLSHEKDALSVLGLIEDADSY